MHLCVFLGLCQCVYALCVITNTTQALSVDCRENTINLCCWASQLLKERIGRTVEEEEKEEEECQEITALLLSTGKYNCSHVLSNREQL